MNDIYRAAVKYARKGIPVFPCGPDKRPLVARGFHAATTDDIQIKAWFHVEQPPNIGIPTGQVSGFFVLDVDRKNGIDGQDALDALVEEHGALPDTVMSITPSGGHHYLFRTAESISCSAGKLGPGLDVRGDGGYIIAPPSGVDGRRYEWEASSGQAGIADAPEWLVALLRPPSPRERRPYQEPTDGDRKRALSALRAIRYGGDSRDEWVEIGMAYAAAGGNFESFDAWCQEQPGYDTDKVAREWASFDANGGITPGTLYWHAKRHGWRDGPELRFSVGSTDDIETIELDAKFNTKGEFIGYRPTLSNVALVLERMEPWAGRIFYNELTEQVEISGKGGRREADDVAVHEIRAWLDTGVKWAGVPTKAIVFDAVDLVASRACYHPVRDYLSGLQWDGVERLAFWLDDVCGVERTPYTMAVATKMLVGAVARAMEPGCKLDTMPVFVGPQGVLKSTMLRELFHFHADTPLLLGSKDAYQGLKGTWCYEFAELASFHGKEVERLKAFFSSAADTYRPSYGRLTVTVPRQCIFVATTNDEHIFHDSTGARRFWAIRVESVDIAALRKMRDQLWAEAVVAYHRGEPWHLEGEVAELSERAADDHYAEDPWESTIAAFVFGREKVTVAEVLEHLDLPLERRTRGHSMRVHRALRDRLKWKYQAIWVDGRAVKGYARTPNSVRGLALVSQKGLQNQGDI